MSDDDGWVEDVDQVNVAAQQQQYSSNNSFYDQSSEFGHSDRSYRGRRDQRGNQRFQRSYDKSNYNRSQNGYSRSQRQNYDDAEKVMVHHSIVGRIIGSGGSNIKDMQKQSGARIKVLQDEGDGNAVPIAISGRPDSVESARKLIQEILDETDKYYGKTRSVAKDESTDNPQDAGEPQTGFLANGNLDWDAILNEGKIYSEKKWGALPPIRKNFYVEDADVADMPDRKVAQWRANNFDLTVEDQSGLNRPILNPVLTFEQAFSQYPEILREIRKQGFEKPSPIQSQIWPIALRGYDAIGIAQTGTGKTLAFLLPIMIHIDLQPTPREERSGPSAVIITPTRELALQIVEEIKKYRYKGMRCVCIYGGGNRRQQIDQVRAGVEIIVATPGRLNDLLACEVIDMMSVTFLVLDEADRMLDLGFEPEINKILIDIRPDRQTIMTSATWPPNVRGMASNHLKEPFQVNVGSLDLAATHTVEQIIEIVEEAEKRERLLRFIEEMSDDDKVLVFVGRKSTCDNVSADLFHVDINCQSIHGGREQYDREQALDEFKTDISKLQSMPDFSNEETARSSNSRGVRLGNALQGQLSIQRHLMDGIILRQQSFNNKRNLHSVNLGDWACVSGSKPLHSTSATRILIATDVASRGLDVRDITHVFNYDLPRNTEEYVHRVGRTGRAGRTGVSISLVTRDDWGTAKELIAILEEAQQEVPAELYQMADRFAAMKERRSMQRRGGGGGRGRSRGGYRRGGW